MSIVMLNDSGDPNSSINFSGTEEEAWSLFNQFSILPECFLHKDSKNTVQEPTDEYPSLSEWFKLIEFNFDFSLDEFIYDNNSDGTYELYASDVDISIDKDVNEPKIDRMLLNVGEFYYDFEGTEEETTQHLKEKVGVWEIVKQISESGDGHPEFKIEDYSDEFQNQRSNNSLYLPTKLRE